MNIDERLEKLTERHEALSQTVQLLAAEVRAIAAETRNTRQLVNDAAEGTARLLHVAQIHEHRISRLEGQSPTT